MALNRVRFDKDNPTEGYEQESDRNNDAIDVAGVYIQSATSNDASVLITRDASDNLTFTDPVLALTKTLSQLAAAPSYFEFLLDNEPIADTGATDSTYTTTVSGGKVTKETWVRNDATNIKTIDYTYSGSKVSTEVRKVFAANGSTIVAQVTWSYTYSGSSVSSATMIRNV